MWITIAIVFLLMLGAFLLGIFLVIRSVAKTVKKVPKQVVKEVFAMVRERFSKPKVEVETEKLSNDQLFNDENTFTPMSHMEWDAMNSDEKKKKIEKEIELTKKLMNEKSS